MSAPWQEQALTAHSPDYSTCSFKHGPIDIIAKLDGPFQQKVLAYNAGAFRFQSILTELCQELAVLRSPVSMPTEPPQGEIALAMHTAVQQFCDIEPVTPMAAVAGANADVLLRTMNADTALTRCSVNNGGDIALSLAAGQSFTTGVCFDPKHGGVSDIATIGADDGIGGIATSGWRGRSHSLGIADSVTVFASNAAVADVAATIVANAVDLPGSAKVMRSPANRLLPDSDLGDRLVTTCVQHLTETECHRALSNAEPLANALVEQGAVRGVHATLQGHRLTVLAADLNDARQLEITAQQTTSQIGATPHA